MERKFLTMKKIELKIQSMEDLFFLIRIEGRHVLIIKWILLAREERYRMELVHDDHVKERKILKTSQIKCKIVPLRFAGDTIETSLNEVKRDPTLEIFFPPYNGSLPSKRYFFG